MKTFELSNAEIDVIRHALVLLDKDCHFDLVTFTRLNNYDEMSECIETMSCVSFLLSKINF